MATISDRDAKKIVDAINENAALIVAISAIIASLPETSKINGQRAIELAQQMAPVAFGASQVPMKAQNHVARILKLAAELEKERE